jgi:hypothetical protein
MTTDRKFRVTVTTETGPALSPAFLEFLKCKLIKCEDAAALGDTAAAAKVESLRRILGPASAPPPKPRPSRPTLVYSRKAPLERA